MQFIFDELGRVLNSCFKENPDDRDYEYAPTVGYLPHSMNFTSYTPPQLDQGSIGSCCGCTGRNVFRTKLKYNYNLDIPVSAMAGYCLGQENDPWDGEDYEGTSPKGVMVALKKHGFCIEKYWPYNKKHKTDRLNGWEEDARLRKISRYENLMKNGYNEYLIKAALTEGPIFGAFYLPQSFSYIPKSGIVQANELNKAGGHAMAIVGYHGDTFKIMNSWGDDFGDKGFCYIDSELFSQMIFSAFKFDIEVFG